MSWNSETNVKGRDGRWKAHLLFVLLTSSTLLGQVVGDLRLHPFPSQVFRNERTLRIWLPPGYSKGRDLKGCYPVLYLNDGQMLFDSETSTFSDQEWRLDETLNLLIREKDVAPVIVVGIDHAGREGRAREYLPWGDIYLTPPVENPRGFDYPQFLVDEVIPWVESRYPVCRDPAKRLLGGASYGALISLLAILKKPKAFGMLFLESPSLYVAEARILEMARNHEVWPEKIYLGIGTHEGRSSCEEEKNQEAVEDVLRLEEMIRRNSLETRLKVVVEPCGRHEEDAYARRLPAALRFFF